MTETHDIPEMLVETIYRCPLCYKLHKSGEDAIACYQSHLTPKEIAGTSYEYTLSSMETHKNYPRFITVEFDDGSYAEYAFTMIKDQPKKTEEETK